MATASKKIATDETLLLVKGAIDALPNATQAAADNANAAATAANNAVARLNNMITVSQIGSTDDYKMVVNVV